jgi:hypothetical protein
MLQEALKVVEAARELRIVRRGTRVATEHASAGLALAMSVLLGAIETFDAAVAAGVGTPDLSPAPEWAVPDALEDEPAFDGPSPSLDMIPGAGVAPEEAVKLSEERQLAAATAAAELGARKASATERPISPRATAVGVGAGLRAFPAPEPGRGRGKGRSPSMEDMGDDGAFFDGDESVGDFLMALDAIDDKLRYAVGKVGWSPRLRALAEAGRIARANMFIDSIDEDGAYVRLPAAVFSSLTVAVAEAALDQDFPEPVPPAPRLRTRDEEEELRLERERDRSTAPRPPGLRP